MHYCEQSYASLLFLPSYLVAKEIDATCYLVSAPTPSKCILDFKVKHVAKANSSLLIYLFFSGDDDRFYHSDGQQCDGNGGAQWQLIKGGNGKADWISVFSVACCFEVRILLTYHAPCPCKLSLLTALFQPGAFCCCITSILSF